MSDRQDEQPAVRAEGEALRVLAKALRRPADETQLSGALGSLMKDSPPLAAHVARVLSRAAPKLDGDLVSDEAAIEVESQAADELAAGRRRKRRRRGSRRRRSTASLGRVDWRFVADDWQLIVEIKLAAALGPEQLERYVRDSKMSDTEGGGVLLLSRDAPRSGDISAEVEAHARWLGVVRWQDVAEELARLPVAQIEPAIADAWQTIIDVADVPGDLRSADRTWAVLRDPSNAGRRRVAAAVLREATDDALVALREELTAASGSEGQGLRRSKGRNYVLSLSVAGDVAPPVRLEMSEDAQRLAVRYAPPDPPKFRRKQKLAMALSELTDAGWRVERGLMMIEVPVAGDEPVEALTSAIERTVLPLCRGPHLPRYLDVTAPGRASVEDVEAAGARA